MRASAAFPTLQRGRSARYRCGTCGVVFATRPRLGAHLRHAYHGFQCLACGALYATRGGLRNHTRQEHEGARRDVENLGGKALIRSADVANADEVEAAVERAD